MCIYHSMCVWDMCTDFCKGQERVLDPLEEGEIQDVVRMQKPNWFSGRTVSRFNPFAISTILAFKSSMILLWSSLQIFWCQDVYHIVVEMMQWNYIVYA